jgi:quinone-modifying oxidoreductase subunit QmoA
MASLKQATYPADDVHISIYYIDIRAIDRFEDFYQKVKTKENIKFIKSKVASIVENKENGNPTLHGVDTEGYNRYANEHDLVVLAVGMEPSIEKASFPVEISINEEGFIEPAPENGGVFAAGCSSDALDVNRAVQHATGAALRAIQVVNRVAATEG